MVERTYYSKRQGHYEKAATLSLSDTVRLLVNVYQGFDNRCYFQEAFGYHCVDGRTYGKTGEEPNLFFYRKLHKNIWPIEDHAESYTEEDLFDIIEILYDLVAKPKDGYHHKWSNCGWHYHTFDNNSGRAEFRSEVNQFIVNYGPGYELSEKGEIITVPGPGLRPLLETQIKTNEPKNVDCLVDAAIIKFRRRGATGEDQLDAVRNLAAVLEYLRPKAKKVLDKGDETDLFNLANNYDIRHHNKNQKSNYDREVWCPWMFYYYLATIHAIVRLLDR